jgi:hypothetical protein
MALVGVASAIAGFVSTGGFSAESHDSRLGCEWSIGTVGEAGAQCVSHGRWLEVARGLDHRVLGVIAVSASFYSGLFAVAASRCQRNTRTAGGAQLRW